MCVNRGGGGGGSILSAEDRAALDAAKLQESAAEERYERKARKVRDYIERTRDAPPSKTVQDKVVDYMGRERASLNSSLTGTASRLRNEYTKRLVNDYASKHGITGSKLVGLQLMADLGGAPLPLQRKIAKLDREIGGPFKVRSPRKPS